MSKSNFLAITKVKYLKDYQLSILFSDGHDQIVDFQQFLTASNNPEIQKYLDKKKFKAFHFENGDLMWGDFDLIFPIKDLYNNSILKNAN